MGKDWQAVGLSNPRDGRGRLREFPWYVGQRPLSQLAIKGLIGRLHLSFFQQKTGDMGTTHGIRASQSFHFLVC